MAADPKTVATAFVAALVSNAAARDAYAATMHPPDLPAALAVINKYAGGATPIEAGELPVVIPLIAKLLAEAKAGGADLPEAILPNDAGGSSGTIMPGDGGGPSGTIMVGDGGGPSGTIMAGDSGGTSGTIMPADKPTDGDDTPK